ncbi:MAG: hypothetical protein Q9167_004056 [Letrouitia subvulpina]
MEGTTTQVTPDNDNVAQTYMALSDSTPFHIPKPQQGDGKIAEGAAGIQSNVRDLLKFYKALMVAKQDPEKRTPLKEIEAITSAHIPLESQPSASERSYGLGLVRTMLPGSLGIVGLNPMYVNPMPLVGKGLDEPRLCIYHQGSIPWGLSSAHLLPDTNTAIVVLTNSMANNDVADWLGQLLLETILDNPDKNDYVNIAKDSAKFSVELWLRMERNLEKHREPHTTQRSLANYVGIYWNIIHNWCIDIYEDNGILKVCFQQQREESYELNHYHHDTFSWQLTRNEDARRGRFPVLDPEFYLLRFSVVSNRYQSNQLIWKHDPDVPSGETFYTSPPGCISKSTITGSCLTNELDAVD